MQEITILGLNGPTIISIPSGAIPEGHTLTITPVKRKEITLEELYEVFKRAALMPNYDKKLQDDVNHLSMLINKLGYKMVKE